MRVCECVCVRVRACVREGRASIYFDEQTIRKQQIWSIFVCLLALLRECLCVRVGGKRGKRQRKLTLPKIHRCFVMVTGKIGLEMAAFKLGKIILLY